MFLQANVIWLPVGVCVPGTLVSPERWRDVGKIAAQIVEDSTDRRIEAKLLFEMGRCCFSRPKHEAQDHRTTGQ
jgi:hypothetical protein